MQPQSNSQPNVQLSPELTQIFNNMQSQVDQHVKGFLGRVEKELEAGMAKAAIANQGSAAAPAAAGGPKISRVGNLPWFGHGLRGFLRKIWYGDHPENPSWSYAQQEGGIERLTLEEYGEMYDELYGIMSEGLAANLADEFTRDIMNIVMSNLQQAYTLGFTKTKTGSAKKAPASKAAAVPPVVDPAAIPVASTAAKVAAKKTPRKIGKPAAAAVAATVTDPAATSLPPDASTSTKPTPPDAPVADLPDFLRPDEPDAEISSETVKSAALKFVIAKTKNNSTEEKEALDLAGIKMTGTGKISPSSARNVVMLVKTLAQDNDLDLGSKDWLDVQTYENLFGAKNVPAKAIIKAAHEIYTNSNDEETGHDFSKVPAASVFDNESYIDKLSTYKKFIWEGNDSYAKIIASRKLSKFDKVKFLRESLRSTKLA